ncbi:MAG: Fe-S protein assembly co-chaperone HscB [Planctomycetes bacterium]|nr:Fe-S protein assembly co-chaperone HscB [Planctomycetota bacterium]
MSEKPEQGVPVKCRHCERIMSQPVVCDYCHAISPTATRADHFTLMGLPQRFDLDERELHRCFIALSRYAHPDFAQSESPEVQSLHLKVSANLNDAYRTLKDPASRAAYLLELLGGASSAEDKSVPEGFLGTTMMLQEELADAKSAGDRAVTGRLKKVLLTQHDGLMKRIASLFDEHGQAVVCEAVRKDLLAEIRKQINAVSYVAKLLSQLS